MPEPTVDPMAPCMQVMEGREMSGSAAGQCPMASVMKDAGEKPTTGFLIMLPGLLFVALGVLILIQPKVLVWMMAGTSIIIGIVLIMLGNFVRSIGARMREIHG